MSQRATAPGGSSIGNSASVIFGDPDIPCFLLLDDPANELLLPAGLGTDCVLSRVNGEKELTNDGARCSRSNFSKAMREVQAEWSGVGKRFHTRRRIRFY